MDAITPLMRVVLDVLDTCERGAGDTEVGRYVWASYNGFDHYFELLQALIALLDLGLIDALFNEFPFDAAISADPIIYEITEAGCAARWALLKAEARYVGFDPAPSPDQQFGPVFFESRAAMQAYLSGAAA